MPNLTTSKSKDGFWEPFKTDAVPWETYQRGERFGCRTKALGEFGGASHVGVLLEELEPGKQACPNHYHLLEEEHLYLIQGTLELRLGPHKYSMSAGDYVCFPAGQKAGHSIINVGTTTARYMLIGEKNPHDVMIYPDSGRVGVRLMGEGYKRSATMDYWEGERGA